MKFTQNERILQIKNETMVVGIDIGKRETHFMPEPLTSGNRTGETAAI